jgi:hypothetical protein
MLNYFPVPARYRATGSVGDEGEWGGKLVGFFFVVFGILAVSWPASSTLGRGTALMVRALGVPVMAPGAQNPWTTIVVGAILIAVGAFMLARKPWAYWAGMALALILFVPNAPYFTLAGLFIIWVLWKCRPRPESS